VLQRSCEILCRYQTVFHLGTDEGALPSSRFILQPLYRPEDLQFSGYILKFRKTTKKQGKRVILGLCRGVHEIFILLEPYAA